MTNIEEAVKRVGDWHNAREQYDLPDMVEMFNSEPFEGADLVSLRASDIRTLLAGIKGAKAEIAECHVHIKACAEENERLRCLVESFPDPAFYEVDEFPKQFEKWLSESMGGLNAKQALKGQPS